MKQYCLLLAGLFSFLSVYAVENKRYTTDRDKEIFEQYITYIAAYTKNHEEVISATANFFLNVPYVAATLEKEPEGLVVNLREMDCTTFVETVFALSKTVLDGDSTFNRFCENLQQFRYRDGKIKGYTGRLHYITDWIYDNTQKKLVSDVTEKIGGDSLAVDLFFMSRNANKYKQLKNNSALRKDMAVIEKKINQRPYFFIPKDRIEELATAIEEGDLICFVTSIPGLDVSHVGIARWESGLLTFIHASSSQKKVIVQPGTLSAYAQSASKNTGIIVVRPNF